MNARSYLRLRLERLETRSLLSAIAMPLVPPAVLPPVPAVLGALHTIDRHSPAQTVVANAVQDGALIPGPNPASTPVPPAASFFTPPPSGDHLSDSALVPDLHRTVDLRDEASVSPVSALVSPNLTVDLPLQQADYGSAPAIEELADTSQTVTVNHANVQAGSAAAIDLIEASAPSPNLEMPRHDLPSLHDTGGQWDESPTFEIHTPPQIRLAEDASPVAPVANDATILPHGTDESEPVADAMSPNHGPALFQAPTSRPADLTFQYTAENDVVLAIEISMPVKARASDWPAGYDPSRTGDPAFGTAETWLPPSNGGASLPATLAPFSDSANSSPGEGGYIILDDAPAGTAQFGNAPANTAAIPGADLLQAPAPISHNQPPASAGILGVDPPQTPLASGQSQASSSSAGFNGLDLTQTPLPASQSQLSSNGAGLSGLDFPQMPLLPASYNQTLSNSAGFTGVGGAQLNFGNWLTDIRPNLNKPADSSGLNQAARSGEKIAAQIPSRPAAAISRPVADAEEGGSIELAIAPPSDTLLPADDAAGGNADQQLSDTRPESGVGLFCDIEVAVAPGLPMVGTASTGISYANAGTSVASGSVNTASSHSATEFVPPLTKFPYTTLVGLADNLPLLLGVTILVSRGGLRLEEEIPGHERHLRVIERLRQS